MNSKIDLKMSRAQYQQLLGRIMDRQDKTQSVLNQMPEMGGGIPGMDPTQAAMNPLQAPAMQPGGLPAQPPPQMVSPVVDQQMAPIPQVKPINSPMGNSLAIAQEVWDEIKGGVGGRLWERIYSTSPAKRGAQTPEDLFLQEYTKFQNSPQEVTDPRVQSFLSTLQPEASAAPSTQVANDPIYKSIMGMVGGGMPNG